MFHSILISTDVPSTILPNLFTLSFLNIEYPLALITGTIEIKIDPVSVGLILEELTYVDVATCKPEGAVTMCFVEVPLAFVSRSVAPFVNPITVPDPLFVWKLV